MLKRNWISRNLETYADWAEVKQGIEALRPQVCGFDTETTGLHIKLDKPFLLQFGFLHPTDSTKGYTFLLDLRYNPDADRIINEWHAIAEQAEIDLATNTKFDVHMLGNIGHDWRDDNLSDLEFFIRYGTDAVQVDKGGAPLALKPFANRYLDPNAASYEHILNAEKSKQVKYYNNLLKIRLSKLGTPPPEYKAKSYTLKVIEDMFKDPLFHIDDLIPEVRECYEAWFYKDLPPYLQDRVDSLVEADMIRYDMLPKEALYKYAHFDIIYLLEGYEKLKPLVEYRHNMWAIKLEESLILPFLDMEDTGLLIDKEYLEESRKRVRAYTLDLRAQFHQALGQKISLGQCATLLKILQTKYNANVDSTGKEVLEAYRNQLMRNDPENPVIKVIDMIAQLRTLEKWYATYILRFQKDLKYLDRIYTNIKQVATVSGRIASDFQQFPKEAIVTSEGVELFHPRRLVLVPPDCKGLLYLDYSQIELRFQAMYTILLEHPDMNMCRAYMPYKCVSAEGRPFDPHNPEDIKHWNDEWFLEEDPSVKWTPTDIHGATTLEAFKSIGLTRDDPRFHALRYVGKRVDFAKNYGASLSRIVEMFPEYSLEECKDIDGAYYKAFPGVKQYHNYCFYRAEHYPYTSNLFGVRYYGANGHKLRNLLVQGSAAHFLKQRIRALWEFQQSIGCKSRMQLQIHDELVWELRKGDPPLAKKFKEIMEDWNDALVPIVAEGEVTTTTWADKQELEL